MIQPRSDVPGNAILSREDDDLLTAEVDGELLGMSVEKGTCYGFNAVGTRIWQLLAEPQSLDRLCEQLGQEYDVAEDVCRSQVLELVERLREEGLLKVEAP